MITSIGEKQENGRTYTFTSSFSSAILKCKNDDQPIKLMKSQPPQAS